jgi:hypothetical protein
MTRLCQSRQGRAYGAGMDTAISESQLLTRASELRYMAKTATTAEAAEVILRLAEWYEDAGLTAVSVSIPRPGMVHWRWRPAPECAVD